MIEHIHNNSVKSILVGDPLGLSKTLISMMAIAKAIPDASRFSIVVLPLRCVDQWNSEFYEFCQPVRSSLL